MTANRRDNKISKRRKDPRGQAGPTPSGPERHRGAEAEKRPTQAEVVLAGIQDGLFVLDKDWRYTYVNPAAAAFLDTTSDQLLGQSVWETWPQAPDSHLRDEFRRAIEQHVSVRFEEFHRPARRWYEYRCHPTDAGLTVLFCDATEHKQVEEALREGEGRYRKLFEAPLAGAYITKIDGTIVDFNDAMMRMLGYDSREELLRKDVSQLYVDPELRPELIRLLQQDGIVPGREAVLRRKDGTLLYALGSAVLLTDGRTGETFIQGVAVDITERKRTEEALRESEQRFRSVLESSLDAAYRQDLRTNRYDYISPVVEQTTGFTPEEVNEFTMADLFARIYPDDRERVQREFYQALQEGMGAVEYRFRCKDDTYRWLADYFVVQKDEKGDPVYRTGNLRNITGLKQAEKALRNSERRFRKLFEADLMGVFVTRPDGTFLDCNDTMVEILGYDSREEVLRHRSSDFYVDPEFRQEAVRILGKEGVYHGQEGRVWRKDGSVAHLLGSAVLLQDEETGEPYIQGVAVDITERKHAEEALRQSEQRFKSTFENAAVGITHVGLDGRFLRCNDRFCEITGYDGAELTGKTFQEITHPDDLKTELGRRERLRKGEIGRYSVEKRYLRKDGTARWVDLTVSAQRDDAGRIEYFIAIVQDISRRKQVEELLRENEQRLRLALDAARTGWWEWNVEQNRVSWDKRVRELLGIGQRGPAGAKVFFRRVEAEDRVLLETLLEKALVDQESFRAEFRVRHSDGMILWVALHGRVIRGEQERAIRIMGVMYDVTQRKQTEAELWQLNERLETQVGQRTAELTRTIERLHDEVTRRVQAEDTLRRRSQMLEAFFQHTISPLAFLDRGFNFVRVNEAFARGAGKDPEFFVGKNLFTVYPPDGNRAIFERVVRTKQPYRTYAVPYAFPDAPQREPGGTYWNWWLTPLLDDYGEVQFLVWSLEDVTEQQRAVQELQERARQLQQLTLELSQTEDRERKRLAEILHDDLQQILAAAKFHVGLLGSQVKSEAERREMTEQIKQMLKDAIDKSRSLSHELNPPGLSHNDLFETFEWLASEVRTKHGLLVHLEACERVELLSEPLKAFLYRAAQEMLFNVIKHANVKEAQLRLCRHGARVYLSVADRGRGFDPQRLGGTGGLGLLSMRERVRLLGGRMRIRSAPGRGSIFVVVVPDPGTPTTETKDLVPEEPAEVPAAPPGEPPEGTADRPLRVLLVDDHKIVREGIQIMLAGEADIEIVGQAGNGREAVELAHRLRPDVVVMDVSMPVMSGDEATRRIKQDLSQTRVVALSMHDNAAVAEKMRRAGAAAYLLKTAPAEDLLAAIRGREVAVRT